MGLDGIRFRYAARIQCPEFLLAAGPQGPPQAELPQYVQVASPPPGREGHDWWYGIYVDDPTDHGRPFDPADETWKQWPVYYLEGIPSLDKPDERTIVLDGAFEMFYEEALQAPIRDEVDPKGFLSVPYYTRMRPTPGVVRYVDVLYAGEYVAPWSDGVQMKPGDWVAISIADRRTDCFAPPERDTAEVLAQVEDCRLFSRPSQAGQVATSVTRAGSVQAVGVAPVRHGS